MQSPHPQSDGDCPCPTCPICLLASDSDLTMFSMFQSIKALPHESPWSQPVQRTSFISRPLIGHIHAESHQEAHAHPLPWRQRQTHSERDQKRHWNCRFWSHRQSFWAKFTHSCGVLVPMFLTMDPSRREEAIFRCYKYFSLKVRRYTDTDI